MTYLPPVCLPESPAENHVLSRSSAYRWEYLLPLPQMPTVSSHGCPFSWSCPYPYEVPLPPETSSSPVLQSAVYRRETLRYNENHTPGRKSWKVFHSRNSDRQASRFCGRTAPHRNEDILQHSHIPCKKQILHSLADSKTAWSAVSFAAGLLSFLSVCHWWSNGSHALILPSYLLYILPEGSEQLPCSLIPAAYILPACTDKMLPMKELLIQGLHWLPLTLHAESQSLLRDTLAPVRSYTWSHVPRRSR